MWGPLRNGTACGVGQWIAIRIHRPRTGHWGFNTLCRSTVSPIGIKNVVHTNVNNVADIDLTLCAIELIAHTVGCASFKNFATT